MNRTWQRNDRQLYFEVSDEGTIEIRYDVFEKLLADAGWQWIPDDQTEATNTPTERINT